VSPDQLAGLAFRRKKQNTAQQQEGYSKEKSHYGQDKTTHKGQQQRQGQEYETQRSAGEFF
jgi:hypothetical protein